MIRKFVFRTGWLLILLGGLGHVWHKWLRHDAPGATWYMGDQDSVSAYVREHAIWWGMIFFGAIAVILSNLMTRDKKRLAK